MGAIPMPFVVELLEYCRLRLECVEIGKLLHPEEPLVEGVVELFNHPVPPRLGARDEPHNDPHRQDEPQHQAQAPWMPIGPPEGHLIVHLKTIWQAQLSPRLYDAPDNFYGLLAPDWFDMDRMRGGVNQVEAVKSCRTLEISRPHQIHLVSAEILGWVIFFLDVDFCPRGIRPLRFKIRSIVEVGGTAASRPGFESSY